MSGRRGRIVLPFFGRRIEQQKNNKNEIYHGLRRLLTDEFSHNNQLKIGVRNGVEYGGEVQQEEVRGKHDNVQTVEPINSRGYPL